MKNETGWGDDEKFTSLEMSALMKKKWTFWILADLYLGSRRFQDFLDNLPDISAKMLNSSLKELEEYGLIKKETDEDTPRLTAYYLTEKGEKTKPFMKEYFIFLKQTTRHSKVNKKRTEEILNRLS